MKKIILILLIFLLTGCFNYSELNKMAIVSSIGVDKENDNYIVSVQVINASKEENDGSKITVYKEKAKSIFEALRRITLKSPKKLYGGHMEKLVLSKEVAEDSIINVIDSFERISEVKNEFNIVILDEGKASDFLKILTTTENIPAEYVKHTIDTASKYSSLTYSTKLDEFLSLYLKKNIDPVIPIVKVNNFNKKGTTLDNLNTAYPISRISTVEKLGLTHNGKVIDYLNEDEVIGYNLLNLNKNRVILSIKCDKNNYVTLSLNNKTKYKTKIKDNKYIITYNLKVNGTIEEYNCSKNLNNKDNINELEKKAKKKLNTYISKILKKQEVSKSEFLGVKRKAYLKNSNYKNEKVIIETNINLNISDIGQTNKSLKGAKKDEE